MENMNDSRTDNKTENQAESNKYNNCSHERKRSRFHLFGGIILVVALVAAVVGACNNGCKFTPDRVKKMISWKVDDVLDDLDASDSQIDRVNQIKERLFAEGEQMMRQGMRDHQALIAEWETESPDKEKIRNLVDNHLEAKRQMAYKLIDASMELHDILTPEQRTELVQEVRDHMEKCHDAFKE